MYRNRSLSTYKNRLPTIDVYKKESAAQFQSEDLLFKMICFPRIPLAVYLPFTKKTIIFQKQNIQLTFKQEQVIREISEKGNSHNFHNKTPTKYQVQHFYCCIIFLKSVFFRAINSILEQIDIIYFFLYLFCELKIYLNYIINTTTISIIFKRDCNICQTSNSFQCNAYFSYNDLMKHYDGKNLVQILLHNDTIC